MKHNRQMIVLMATCLSSLFFATEGLIPLSKPTISLIKPYNQLPCPRLSSKISSRPSVECQTKRDPSVDIDTDEDEKRYAEMKEGSKEQGPGYESNGIESGMGNDVDNDFGDSKNTPASTSPNISLTTAVFATLIFVSFWPLLALLRSTTSPIDGFDVDMFMALKGIMDTAPMDSMDPSTIVELPSLSPAEQLVGAIFGPPQ
uniref:Uncharacterized protein n=1 Tax=Pseudo-nitzschia delicatissima TaxID=44447 RepID=A0A7S0XQM7_9STRA|mmetsp:Transcript_581/g.1295  ORF Transcript_581/g.1295 Transcript_581/m.1295 type:complete len:202 (+) Transcript_581:116-721(+)